MCVRRWLTQHPLHDQHLCPGELCGLDPEHLSWVVRNGLVGQVLDTFKAVWGIDNQQTQEDGEGNGMSHKLHEGASQDLTNLKVMKIGDITMFDCVTNTNNWWLMSKMKINYISFLHQSGTND